MSANETTAQDAAAQAKQRPRKKKGRLIPWPLRPGNKVLVFTQEMFNKIFTPSLNPLYFTGAITFLLFWVVLASGVYLYFFYSMNPMGAYKSVQYITEEQQYYGGIMRSLHRYASDGLVIIIAIHMAQVFFSDRFRRYRWFAWVSGAVIIPIIWFEGVSGYFLVWDETAQMIAFISADLLDVLPINVEPLQRNFLTNDSVNSLLFFVMCYLHLAIPIGLLVLAWVHCMRISMPLITPPNQVTVAILFSLVVLSLIKPAVSAGPADLSRIVGTVNIDWFFIPFYPLVDYLNISSQNTLLIFIAGYAVFTALPWLIPDPKKADETAAPQVTVPQCPVKVDLETCKGCYLCQDACPFEAMKVIPRTDGKHYDVQAMVHPTRCAECGFCVNACEFGAVSMGEWSKSEFQDYIEDVFKTTNGIHTPSSIAFICERSFDEESFFDTEKKRLAGNKDVAYMVIPCIGVVSPAIVDYSKKAGAKGIMVIGCRGLDCHYREERRRLKVEGSSKRYQFVVEKMEDPSIKIMLISPFELDELQKEINEFNDKVKTGANEKAVTDHE